MLIGICMYDAQPMKTAFLLRVTSTRTIGSTTVFFIMKWDAKSALKENGCDKMCFFPAGDTFQQERSQGRGGGTPQGRAKSKKADEERVLKKRLPVEE